MQRLFSVLLSLLSLTAVEARAAQDLLAVDTSGAPIPGLRLRLDRSPIGELGADLVDTVVETGAQGRAEWPADGQPVVDVQSLDPSWAVAFVHARRAVDDDAPPTLTGALQQSLAPVETCVCVLQPTGTLELSIPLAKRDERFHVVFVDERPEPAAHRTIRSARSFTGSSAHLLLPAGRGTLYVAKEGSLGGVVEGANGALLVAISPGGSTRLTLAISDGPETLLMAPFETIPFDRLEALGPDGESVVASFGFDRSPLGLPSTRAMLASTPAPRRTRMPRHLLRAADVPLLRPAIAPSGSGGERFVQPPPVELIFSIEVGTKMRLPEVEAGWVRLAQAGAMMLAGPTAMGSLHAQAPGTAPGRLTLPATGRDAGEEGPWSLDLALVDPKGEALAYREVLVTERPGLVMRGLTDGAGRISIDGLTGDSVRVASCSSTGQNRTIARARAAGSEVETWTIRAGARQVTAASGDAKVNAGALFFLQPKDASAAESVAWFGTHGLAVGVADCDGVLRFDAVEPGAYELRRLDDGSTVDLEIPAGEGAFRLSLDQVDGELRVALPR